MLRINPIRSDRFGYTTTYCMEDCIATISNYENREYQMMFLESYKFNYDIEITKKNKEVFEGITIIAKDFDHLKLFHGIVLHQKEKTNIKELIEVVKLELAQKRTIILNTDAFYCPWDELAYQKFHNSHAALAIGIDNEFIYLCDPFHEKVEEKLSLKELDRACKWYITYKLESVNFTRTDIKNIFYKEVVVKKELEKVFQNFKDLSHAFFNYFNQESELDSDEKFELCQQSLHIILLQRTKNLSFMKYLLINENYSFSPFQEKAERIIQAWVIVKNMLVKAYFSKIANINEKIGQKIFDIYILEKNFYEEIVEKIYNNSGCAGSEIDSELVKNNCDKMAITQKEQYFVNLSDFLNNSGFGSRNNKECKSNFTGINEFIEFDNIKKELVINGIKFRTAINPSDDYDNISCNKQSIEVSSDFIHDSLFLLATSEFGDTFESIKVFYENGNVQEIYVKLTDFIAKPVYGETIAWKGKTYWKENKNSDFSLRFPEVYLFSCQYKLLGNSKVKSLLLPNCNNMHVFAITLQ